MGTRATNTVFVVLLLGIAAVIYALNRFTPLASDDWNYVFIFGTWPGASTTTTSA